jgi:hypothetical protein
MLRNYGERFGPKPLRKCPFLRPGGRETTISKKILWFSSPKSPKSLKNRALRALRRVRVGHQNRESAAGAGEIESHDKITDSEVDL